MCKLHQRGGNYNPTGKRGALPPPEKTTNLNVRCSPMFKEQVKLAARQKRMSQSEFLEAAVAAYLAQQD